MHDVIVVGGGPAGCISASLLSGDHDVLVLEEHKVSGSPVQCAGLVTEDVIGMFGVKPDILNTVYGANVHFPGGGCLTVRSDKPKGILVDRGDLDRKLADAAADAGAEFVYGERYKNHRIAGDRIIVNDSAEASLLVGADGHTSAVSAFRENNGPREYIRGIQADVRCRRDEQELMDLRIDNDLAPGFFTWEIPFGDYVRVGLCSRWDADVPSEYLKRLLKRSGLEDAEIVAKYSGKIPLGGRKVSYGDRILLIGDAAGQVKPVSAGGLYPIAKAAPYLKKAATRALSSGDFTAKSLKEYEKGWKGELGKELSRGYRIRKMYSKLNNNDFNRIYNILDRDDIRSVLGNINLDSPSSVALPILKNPAVGLRFLPIILKAIF